MSGRSSRSLLVLLVLVSGLLAAAVAIRYGLETRRLPSSFALAYWGGLVGLFLGSVLLILALMVAFRALNRRMARRAGPPVRSNMRALESTSAVLVAGFVAIAALGGLGNALVSLGLVGFGLTLALQRPILAMAGWATIRFGRLFTEGDRIEVQGIVGDVVHISLLKTKIWEIGSTHSPLPWGGAVSPLRETGRVVTLSNATFVEHPVANATEDTSYVFDEFAISVAYEADWKLAEGLLKEVGTKVINLDAHARAADRYERLTRGLATTSQFPREPVVIMKLDSSWIELRLRYLVDVRRRSATRTALARAWQEATAVHADKLPNVYPRVPSMRTAADGRVGP
jgi:small-conductance mechanosensitive channel